MTEANAYMQQQQQPSSEEATELTDLNLAERCQGCTKLVARAAARYDPGT